jgi:hypothetical protein
MPKKQPSVVERLASHAWEILPEYGNAQNMQDAQRDGIGTCLHRSILIGRRALELGLPCMRRITFGPDMMPWHFANYVKPNDSWLHVSTGRDNGRFSVGNHAAEFAADRFYAAFGGLGIERLEIGGSARTASAVIIPEAQMGKFRECVLAQQYLRTAYLLLELT